MNNSVSKLFLNSIVLMQLIMISVWLGLPVTHYNIILHVHVAT